MTYRSIGSVRIITEYGVASGLPLTALLNESGISADQLNHGNTQIEDAQELKVLNNLADLTDDIFQIGRALGGCYQLTSYGIWGYALLASPNLHKAIELGLRYLDLTYAFCQVELRRVGDKARIVFTPKHQGHAARLALYRDMWAMMVIQKDLFADKAHEFKLGFTESSPAGMPNDEFTSQMGGVMLFDQTQNYVEFDWQYLSMQLPRGNDVTASMCEQQCQALLEKKQSLSGVAHEIRALMLKHGMQISMEFVALQLATTSRTLKAQGTSWRCLRDDVRCAMAEELLAVNNIQLDEIAERLGFSDGANFSHAFKRWRGVSPLKYRASLTA
ncbi:AraC family transcriptional regulator ligand-binding domain-containing protein [Pseudomonas sp. HK3]